MKQRIYPPGGAAGLAELISTEQPLGVETISDNRLHDIGDRDSRVVARYPSSVVGRRLNRFDPHLLDDTRANSTA